MKKILIAAMAIFGLTLGSFAQTSAPAKKTTASTSTSSVIAPSAKKTTTTTTVAHTKAKPATKKDGTPDMRYAANKKKKKHTKKAGSAKK